MSDVGDVILQVLQDRECWCLNDWVCRRCQAIKAFEEMSVFHRAMRAALEWYANDRNYSEDTGAAGTFQRIPSTPDQAPGEFVFEPDCGDVARAALVAPSAGQAIGEEC